MGARPRGSAAARAHAHAMGRQIPGRVVPIDAETATSSVEAPVSAPGPQRQGQRRRWNQFLIWCLLLLFATLVIAEIAIIVPFGSLWSIPSEPLATGPSRCAGCAQIMNNTLIQLRAVVAASVSSAGTDDNILIGSDFHRYMTEDLPDKYKVLYDDGIKNTGPVGPVPLW